MNFTKIAGKVFRSLVYMFLLCPLCVVICTAFSDDEQSYFPAPGIYAQMVRESLCQHGIPELFDFERKDSLRQRCYSLRTGNDGEPLVLEVRQQGKRDF